MVTWGRFFVLLFSLAISGCETLAEVDKGLYSATDSVSQRDRITGRRTLTLKDRAQQIEAGNAFADKFLADAKTAGKKTNADVDKVAYERILRVFSRLHAVSHVRDEKWTPVLVEDKSWNAFTTGGTYFVVYSALEHDLKDDAELANVIAHEMGHTVANHVFETEGYMQLSALSHSKAQERGTFQAAFTHENEAEADRIAVLYCALAGYDPYAGARIWQRMLKAEGNDALFVHDHPMNSERAQQAQEVAEKVAKYYSKGKQNPEFAAILKDNEIFSYQEANSVAAGSGGGLLAALDATLTTMEERDRARAEEERQQSRIRFMESVQNVSSVVSSDPIGPTAWRVVLQYNGNLPLTDLSFKLVVKQPSGQPLSLTQSLTGVLRPNTTFAVDFTAPELRAYEIQREAVVVFYDNATVAR